MQVYMVCGVSDATKTVLGIYPTKDGAQQRVEFCQNEFNYDVVWFTSFDTDANGVDLEIDLQ